MINSLVFFFHNKTQLRNEVIIPAEIEKWPSSWKEKKYKKYPLYEEICIPKVTGLLLSNFLLKRKSIKKTNHIAPQSISFDDIAYILKCCYGTIGDSSTDMRRAVPSAGALYPLEIYLFLCNDIPHLNKGIYHYGVKKDTIEPVFLNNDVRQIIGDTVPEQEWMLKLNGFICITGRINDVIGKYGTRGYRYLLLEAGHVGQNITLACTERGIDSLPVGGIDEPKIEDRVGFNINEESIIYTIFF